MSKSCPTHCCPVHGCKYSEDDCPVKSGEVAPTYPLNNGCEMCESDAEDLKRLLTQEVKDKIVAESPTLQTLIDERDALRAEIRKLKGETGPYDVPIVVFTRVEEGGNYRDAAFIAEAALRQLIREHGEQMPETGTMALYAKHGQLGKLGPVKIAKIREINVGGYDTGLVHKAGFEPYRFWDLTPEQIEEMNREAMGG